MSAQLPVRISWRRMRPSPRLEAAVRAEARRLAATVEHEGAAIVEHEGFCRLVLERPAGTAGEGRCHVDLLVALPGRRVLIGRLGDPVPDEERLRATIHETFEAARQRLKPSPPRR